MVIVLLVASSEVSVSAMIVLWSSIVLPRIEMLMPLIIIVGSRHLLILLHDLKQLLKDLCNVGVRLPVTCMRGAELLSHVLLEVSLVDCVLDLNFSVLFDFKWLIRSGRPSKVILFKLCLAAVALSGEVKHTKAKFLSRLPFYNFIFSI